MENFGKVRDTCKEVIEQVFDTQHNLLPRLREMLGLV